MNRNRTQLKTKILELKNKPISNNLEINSKGNFINILKGEGSFYLLLIPSKPLSVNKSQQIINLGFKEKFPKINYSKFINYNDKIELKKIEDDIVYIFNTIFQVPHTRQWRFSISSGMGLLKDMIPMPTVWECRNQTRTRSFNFKILFKYDILISIIIGLIITIIFRYNESNISLSNIELLACASLFVFFIIKFSNFIESFTDKSKTNRLFTRNNLTALHKINFKKVGSRCKGVRNGYKVEIYYNTYLNSVEVAVHHEEIPWERVLKLSEKSQNSWSNKPFITWRSRISRIEFRNRSFIPNIDVIIKEIDSFLFNLKELNIKANKQTTIQ
ncbi:hypothetical protein [Marinifilum flexuosum]|uniref:Uncharacterized protein n=1 Tax=Marinifilum flexuosum TaxID=1117708 RepID=A0A419XAH0_9BACT|nr:hypothetical protein [Marinifilum flexuosum]RKE04758.1 hypothetical protein BXY64_1785 [Marinifilum flexuosum]